MLKEIAVVTSNENKAKEASQFLKLPIVHYPVGITEIQDFDPLVVVEDKAKKAFSLIYKPVIVDDVALYLDCLKGFPGPYIKDFLKKAGNQGICDIVAQTENNIAVMQTTLGFFDGKRFHYGQGNITGTISKEAAQQGSGINTFFIPDGTFLPRAMLTPKLHERFSSRRLAYEELKSKMEL